jgi:hypothetical protein
VFVGFPLHIDSSALYWDITQRRVVIPYRRFGTTYRSYLQGGITTLLCVIFQKSADLIQNVSADALRHQQRINKTVMFN